MLWIPFLFLLLDFYFILYSQYRQIILVLILSVEYQTDKLFNCDNLIAVALLHFTFLNQNQAYDKN